MVNSIQVYVGLGSNVGNKEQNLTAALTALDANSQSQIRRVSSLYLTAPVGYLEQDLFINAVAEITTCLDPDQLLSLLQDIEASLGRVRTVPWGPRTIDLDILLYGRQTINTQDLTVPHPRAVERAFVLRPLAELNPGLRINGEGIDFWLKKTAGQKIDLFKSKWFAKLK